MLSMHGDQVFFRDGSTNIRINQIGQARSLFNTQAGPGTHVETNLSRVNLREEIASQKEIDASGEHAESQEADREDDA